MALLLLFMTISAIVNIANSGVIWDPEWEDYKAKYDKHYSSLWDEQFHHLVFTENKKKIETHMALFYEGRVPFKMGMNQFGDLTNEEFNAMVNGLKPEPHGFKQHFRDWSSDVKKDVPDSIDWRDKGYVTPVKDQGDCGSCYAFSATGSIEGQHFAKTGQLISLSEQQLVDCSIAYGNIGCQAGITDNAFDYLIDAGAGIELETSYPYTAKLGICKYQANYTAATITGYTDLTCGDEEELRKAVGTVGPVSVAVDASHISFQFYSGGIYYEPNCTQNMLDHGMLVVGYDSQDGSNYWIVKNSWGTSWGEEGYILMSRNRDNNCGIASLASYPTV